MRTQDVVKAKKSKIRMQEWGQGNMPPSAFRLRKDLKAVKQGKSNKWRVITFSANYDSFRVLILYNPDRFIYRATLGIEKNGVVNILCVHEYHASEPGWHCHVDRKRVKGVTFWNHSELQKWPKKPLYEAKYEVDTLDRTTEIALKFYKITEEGPLL